MGLHKKNNFNKGLVSDFSPLQQPDGTFTYASNSRLSQVGNLYVWTNEQGIGTKFSLPDGFIVIGSCSYVDRFLFMFIFNPTNNLGGFCWWDVELNTLTIKQWNPLGLGFEDMLTTLFNFSLSNMIECFARGEVDGSISIYFTDNLNPIRVINTQATYSIANFGQINLVQEVDFPYIQPNLSENFDITTQTGGTLKAGNYIYYFRYKDVNFNYTNWSTCAASAVVGNGDVQVGLGTDLTNFAGGGRPGTTTNKRVQVSLQTLDTSFTYIDIVYIWFNGQDAEVWIIPNLAFNTSSFIYNHTVVGGGSQVEIPLDSLSNTLFNVIAKSITTIDNRLFAGNIQKSTLTIPEFKTIADNLIVDYDINDDQIDGNGLQWRDKDGNVYDSNIGAITLDSLTYKSADYAGKNVGYWRDELYQFAIAFQLFDGSWTQAYPIGLYRDWREGVIGNAIKDTDYGTGSKTGVYRMPPRYRNNPGQPNPKEVYYWNGATLVNRGGEVIYDYTVVDINTPVNSRVLHPIFTNKEHYGLVSTDEPFAIIQTLLDNRQIQGFSIVRSPRIKNIQYSTIGWSGIQSISDPNYSRPAEKIIPYLYGSTDEPYTQYALDTSPFGVRQEDTIPPQYLLELRANTLFLWSSDYVLTADTPNTAFNSTIPQGQNGVVKVVDVSSFYDWKGDYIAISPTTPQYDFNNNNGIADTDWGIFYGMNYRDEIADASGADGELLCSLWDDSDPDITTDEVYLLYIATRRYLHEKTTTNVKDFVSSGILNSLGSDDREISLPIYHFGDVDPANWYEGRVVGAYSIQNGYKVEGTRFFVGAGVSLPYLTDGNVSCVLPSHYCVEPTGTAIYDRTGLATEYDNKVYHANIANVDIETFTDADIANYYPLPKNQRYFFCNNFYKEAASFSSGISVIKIYNGDCFINRNVLKIFYSINRYKNGGSEPANQMYPRAFGFITENNYNHVFRYNDFDDTQPISGLVGSNMDKFLASTQAFQIDNNTGDYNRKEALFYNQGNHQNLGGIFLTGFDDTNPVPNARFPVRILYSEKDLYETVQDNFRVFLPANYRDYDNTRGEINKLIEFNNQLISIQDTAINLHIVNERALLSESAGIALKIGAGDVLVEKPQYISTSIGSKHQWSIFKSFDSIYGVQRIGNKITVWKFDGDGLKDITLGLFARKLFQDRIGDGRYYSDTPLLRDGIVGGFNPNTRDIYFTFLDPTNPVTIMGSEITNSFISEQNYYPSNYMPISRVMFIANDFFWMGGSSTRRNEVFSMNNTNNGTINAPWYYFNPTDPDGTVLANPECIVEFVVKANLFGENGMIQGSDTIGVFDYYNIVSNRVLPYLMVLDNSTQSANAFLQVQLADDEIRYLEKLWRAPFVRNQAVSGEYSRFRDNYIKIRLHYSLSKEESVILQEFVTYYRESKQ